MSSTGENLNKASFFLHDLQVVNETNMEAFSDIKSYALAYILGETANVSPSNLLMMSEVYKGE